MGRPLLIDQGMKVTLTKFTKEQVWGSLKLVALSDAGEILSNANISNDNLTIIPKGGMKTRKYYNLEGKNIPSSDIISTDIKGIPLPLTTSSYKAGIKTETLSFEEALCVDIDATFYLQGLPEELEQLKLRIKENQAKNQLISFNYSYFDSIEPQKGFMILYEDRIIALLGRLKEPIWNSLQIVAFEEEEEKSDEEEEEEEERDVFESVF